jgi:hypothetical protein
MQTGWYGYHPGAGGLVTSLNIASGKTGRIPLVMRLGQLDVVPRAAADI